MPPRPLRILTTSLFYYYGDTRGVEPQFYYLAKVPQSMGHQVDFFDWHTHAKPDMAGSAPMRRLFLNLLLASVLTFFLIHTLLWLFRSHLARSNGGKDA